LGVVLEGKVCEAREVYEFGADVLAGGALPQLEVGEAREGAERGASLLTRKFGQKISEVDVQVCQGLEFLDVRKECRGRRTR
jgi:hypothetical protein